MKAQRRPQMSQGQIGHDKNVKKKPAKTLKEKRLEKAAKKAAKSDD